MNEPSPKLRLRRPRTAGGVADGPPRLAAPHPLNGGKRSPAGVLRRLAQPLPLIGLVLIVIAAAGYLTIAAGSRTERSEVVVAARSLPAGSRLSGRDLRLAKLGASSALLARLIPAARESSLLGRRLAAPVVAGLPLGRDDLAGPGGGPAAFTLTVPALHALGGNLAVGDRVSVLATFTSQSGAASTRVIARHLTVLSVGQPPAGIDQSATTVPITVALADPSLASELALANSVGKIDLLRDGRDPTAPIPAVSVSQTGATP